MAKPFRWSIARREQLGAFVGALERPEAWFLEDLRTAAAKVVAFADGADLAFVGRTPENFFDYLSGAFEGWDEAPRLHLVQYSLRWVSREALSPANLAALGDYFEDEGVGPRAIVARGRGLALVDLIASGGTMKSIVHVLRELAARDRVDWNAVQRQLRIVGLTSRTKNSPNTWRWQQNQDWLDLIPDATIKNVSASWGFLKVIGDEQDKVTSSFTAARWQEGEAGAPATSAPQRAAIAHAAFLYDLGRSGNEREALAAAIATLPEMKRAAVRAVVAGLRR